MLNLFWLIVAITFELVGDASIRIGLWQSKWPAFAAGVVMLIVYGCVVSFPNWSFSRTMGVYIAIFFIISQLVAKLLLKEEVGLPSVVGGILIVSGGLLILCWNPR